MSLCVFGPIPAGELLAYKETCEANLEEYGDNCFVSVHLPFYYETGLGIRFFCAICRKFSITAECKIDYYQGKCPLCNITHKVLLHDDLPSNCLFYSELITSIHNHTPISPTSPPMFLDMDMLAYIPDFFAFSFELLITNKQDLLSYYLFYCACLHMSVEDVEFFYKRINYPNCYVYELIIRTIKLNKIDNFKFLMERYDNRESLVNLAIRYDNLDILRFLIEEKGLTFSWDTMGMPSKNVFKYVVEHGLKPLMDDYPCSYRKVIRRWAIGDVENN